MRRTSLLLLPALLLVGCAGEDQAGEEVKAAPVTSEAVAEELDPTLCLDDPEFLEQNAEFCYGGGYVTDEVPTADYDSEGSVTTEDGSFVEYPDGLKVTLTGVEVADPEVFREQESGETPLVIVTKWENVGTEPVELAGYNTASVSLLAGVNGFEAPAYAVGGDDTSLPARVMPGTSFEYRTYHSVADPSVLEVRFTPDPAKYTEYAFTDVETLLAG